MKGLEISKAYAQEYGIPMLLDKFYQYVNKVAVGLVGEGSECFGFDDSFSQDHDFGAGFCIWLPEEDYRQIGAQIQNAYNELPKNYMGYERKSTYHGVDRVGVISIQRFYSRYIGLDRAPHDNMEWLRIPETFLATATNGQVFLDNFGKFSDIRSTLLGFYPKDVVKKKIAARLAVMAQSGQYNYMRSINRGSNEAAYMACNEFVKAALSTIYLINEHYMPFYKWSFKGLEKLTKLKGAASKLSGLIGICDNLENAARKQQIIDEICNEIVCELNLQGFTRTTDTFLETHGLEIMDTIEDSRLRNMHIMLDAR